MKNYLITLMKIKKSIIQFLAILLSMTLFFLCLSCNGHVEEPQVSRDLKVLSIYKNFNQAKHAARQLRADAYLYFVTAQVLPQESSENLSVTYGFQSKMDDPLWINVSMQKTDTGMDMSVSSGEEKSSNYGLVKPPLELSSIKSDSPEVLDIMMNLGGDDFLSRYDVDVPIRLKLWYVPKRQNNVEWIAYFTNEAKSIYWRISVDATDNNIVDFTKE